MTVAAGIVKSGTRLKAKYLALTMVFLAAFCPSSGSGAEKAGALNESPAAIMMGKKLYAEAARLLETDIKGGDSAGNDVRFLMLGECYYLQAKYAEARPWFLKAFQSLPAGKNRIIAQYRLACVDFRLSETANAIRKTDDFVREFPHDERSGKLLIMKMKALARTGKGAEKDLEALRRQVAAKISQYGADIDVAADKVLSDFYQANGGEDKAVGAYLAIVSNFRKVQAQCAQENKPVPEELQETHDYAALRLGAISLKDRRESDAVRWLESVRFTPDMVRKARLTLAQVAYDARDYRLAESYLLKDHFIEVMPPGEMRSDMYLLLGFCAKKALNPSLEQVLDCFGKVDKDSKAYYQAQMGMADTSLRWRKPEQAAAHFENASASAKYAAEALYNLGKIYLEAADQATSPDEKQALLAKSADRYSSLMTQHAMTAFAQDAGESIRTLRAKGFTVRQAASDQEVIRQWESAVTNAPGSSEAARALISLARMHQNSVLREDTREFIKAPDFAACAHACNRLLDESVYTGRDLRPEQWDAMRAEALYYRGLCVVSSLGQQPAATNAGARPVYVKAPNIQQAMEDLSRARERVNPKEIELLRNIEVVQLEALFKSDSEEKRREAEKRIDELTEKYGRDPRLQRLAMDLGKWHHEQGHYSVAADAYKGIADRAGVELSQDEIMKLLFLAGKLYSRAAHEAAWNPSLRKFAFQVQPREKTRSAGILETYKPFRKVVRLDGVAGELTGEQAIRKLSEASQIPFVWASGGRMGQYLKNQRVKLGAGPGTVRAYLQEILDLKTQDLSFDIGLTKAPPTLTAGSSQPAPPGDASLARTIELHGRGDWEGRYEPMARRYGVWSTVHRGPVMLFSVFKRVEELTGARVLWAEGVNRDDVLATEYREPPGINPTNANPSVAQVLTALLDAQELTFRLVPRNIRTELYEKAKECFDAVRSIAPRSPQGEEALFLLALNYYRQEDYNRMRIVLEEYIKSFDGTDAAHFHQACFWVGWVHERNRRFLDAAKAYQRATEEYVTIIKSAAPEASVSKEALAASLSYDTRFALAEAVSGSATNMPFADLFIPFVRLATGVDVRLDRPLADLQAPVVIADHEDLPVFDLLWDALKALGLSFRTENVDREYAEKAYYRLAVCLKQEALNEQALGACETLLTRYPASSRKQDALNLRLDIHKALKNYGSMLKDMERLRSLTTSPDEARRADYARAWVLMDLCRYPEAAEVFKPILAASTNLRERVVIRDGYARALLRGGDTKEALAQYEALLKEDTSLVRLFVEDLMVWYLRRATGAATGGELPAGASNLIRSYEAMDEKGRAGIDRETAAKVSWVYYTTGLYDLLQRDPDRALAKFDAAANSPDDALAADAILRAAEIHLAAGRAEQARDALEHLIFSTQSVEGEVCALYLLSQTLLRLGDAQGAEERMQQLLKRFPDSRQAMQISRERAGQPSAAARRPEEKTGGNAAN